MSCGLTNTGGCITEVINGVVSNVFQALATWFADAADSFITAFAQSFAGINGPDLAGAGLDKIYGMSLGIAGIVAALLLMIQVARTLWTRSGEPIAQASAGLVKACLAFTFTLTIGAISLQASDELTTWIITQCSGSISAFSSDLATILVANTLNNNGLTNSGALLLLVALVSIVVVIILWIEMIMRNAALAVLIATSPIPAAGMMGGEATAGWWSNLLRWSIQLIVLKPTIALVFALGFSISTDSTGTTQVITGLCILGLAVIAWPCLARFMAWTSSQATAAGGMSALLGFAAAKGSQALHSGPVGSAAGSVAGGESGQATSAIARATRAASGAGAGAAASPLGVAVMGVKAAASVANAAVASMDQMAGHAGVGSPSTRLGRGSTYSGAGGIRSSAPNRTYGSRSAAVDPPPPIESEFEPEEEVAVYEPPPPGYEEATGSAETVGGGEVTVVQEAPPEPPEENP